MHRGKGIAAAAVAAVVLLLLMWGSGSGTSVLSSPSGEAGAQPPPTRTIEAPQDVAATSSAAPMQSAPPALDWLMIFFAVVGLIIFIQIIKWLLNREWEQSEAPAEDELLDDLDLLLAATSESARTRALSEGEPRNVVVRCWVALEDAAATSGLDRDPAETAAEFTRRFLGVWDVDESLTRELADLYREARFSRHEVTRETGDRAVEVVSRIHEQLRTSDAQRAEAAATSESAPTSGGEQQ